MSLEVVRKDVRKATSEYDRDNQIYFYDSENNIFFCYEYLRRSFWKCSEISLTRMINDNNKPFPYDDVNQQFRIKF